MTPDNICATLFVSGIGETSLATIIDKDLLMPQGLLFPFKSRLYLA